MNPLSRQDFQLSQAAIGAQRGSVVNRTHRVLRERARVLDERRTRARSLMIPLLLCSVLLTLTICALWTGLYQYQAVEVVGADVAAFADANNHLVAVVLWFLPLSLAVVSALWVRRSRSGRKDEIR